MIAMVPAEGTGLKKHCFAMGKESAMSELKPSPALESTIEACADCVNLYSKAADVVEEEAWRLFMRRMALRRETLLHRLRFVSDGPVEQHETEDFVTLRGRLGELTMSLKSLFGDQIRTTLTSLEQAETRLVDCLGAIGVASADPTELSEMFEAVTEERDALRNLLSGMNAAAFGTTAGTGRLE
jgi:hypothetical protein